jgi:hypothetical protein
MHYQLLFPDVNLNLRGLSFISHLANVSRSCLNNAQFGFDTTTAARLPDDGEAAEWIGAISARKELWLVIRTISCSRPAWEVRRDPAAFANLRFFAASLRHRGYSRMYLQETRIRVGMQPIAWIVPIVVNRDGRRLTAETLPINNRSWSRPLRWFRGRAARYWPGMSGT